MTRHVQMRARTGVVPPPQECQEPQAVARAAGGSENDAFTLLTAVTGLLALGYLLYALLVPVMG